MSVATSKVKLEEVPQGRLGMWILIAGELVIFGGLIASYLLYRSRHETWTEMAEHTNLYLGALNTFVLLTSSYFAVLAHKHALRKDIKKVSQNIIATIVCALIFLVVKGVEYSTEISHGFTLPGNDMLAQGETVNTTYWAFYFLMTGLHGLHVIVGAIILLVIMLQVKKGKNFHRVELAGLYWHMVDIVWIFLFPILYIAH
jgi:heme/copper-type cytochrome/quinol oxidase subunit 3